MCPRHAHGPRQAPPSLHQPHHRTLIEQHAGGALAAPAAAAAVDQPHLNSSGAAQSGQLIACTEVIYPGLPHECGLIGCACDHCIRLCTFLSGARWRRRPSSHRRQEPSMRSVRGSLPGQAVTATHQWPQMQAGMSSHPSYRNPCACSRRSNCNPGSTSPSGANSDSTAAHPAQ